MVGVQWPHSLGQGEYSCFGGGGGVWEELPSGIHQGSSEADDKLAGLCVCQPQVRRGGRRGREGGKEGGNE